MRRRGVLSTIPPRGAVTLRIHMRDGRPVHLVDERGGFRAERASPLAGAEMP